MNAYRVWHIGEKGCLGAARLNFAEGGPNLKMYTLRCFNVCLCDCVMCPNNFHAQHLTLIELGEAPSVEVRIANRL